jgi:tetratricopeptide (TPR) repeat protein
LVDFSKAIELDSNNKEAYRRRGYTYYHLGEYENALADYNKAIEIDPNDAHSYWQRGDIYRCMGEYDKAITDYNQTIEIDRKNYLAYNNRGFVYMIQKRYEEALDDFKKAMSRKSSNFPYPSNNTGYVYLQQGKYDLAIEYFNKCLSIDDKLFAANLNLALVYYENGDQEKAGFNLERAKELAPELQDGPDSIPEFYQKWIYWTEKDKETLRKMFEELR